MTANRWTHPSKWGAGLVVLKQKVINQHPSRSMTLDTYMKNCEPFVFGPLLAMERRYGCSCLSWKFSSTRQKNKMWLTKVVRTCTQNVACTHAQFNLSYIPGMQDTSISMYIIVNRTTELWPLSNHQPSLYSAQVVLNTTVTHLVHNPPLNIPP